MALERNVPVQVVPVDSDKISKLLMSLFYHSHGEYFFLVEFVSCLSFSLILLGSVRSPALLVSF